jgi:thiol-disulfide isomerase/thioredoxin
LIYLGYGADLFSKLLEKRSLFTASEYLALKLLNEKRCTINNDLAARLESYRAMKKGNIAPGFEFKEDCLAPDYEPANAPQKFSDINSNYIVVVFGAGWCPQCHEELSSIARLYEKWQKYSVEVVFVSLDEDKKAFKNFAGDFPFISTCDYKKWESPTVKEYHVFATPTLYLLNNKREIILRPNSVIHMDSWVDWYLVKGNQ